MPDPFERRSRPNGCCEDWSGQPSRSQLRTSAVAADVREPARKAAGKKDPALCKAAHWKGPHRPELRVSQYRWPQKRGCRWDASWSRDEPGWFCDHEEACAGCGKILRSRIPRAECPDFVPIAPGQHAAIMAGIRRREDELAASRARFRKPPVTGPQGYRKRRSA